MRSFTVIFKVYFILIQLSSSNKENSVKITNTLESFRKTVEEIPDESSLSVKTEDTKDDLISFLVNNVYEIFGETGKTTDPSKSISSSNETTTVIALRKTVALPSQKNKYKNNVSKHYKDSCFETETDENEFSCNIIIHEKVLKENITEPTEVTKHTRLTTNNSTIIPKIFKNLKEKTRLINVSKSFLILEKAETLEDEPQRLESNDISILSKPISEQRQKVTGRSCVYCNNIAVMDCYDPRHKLIPSIICERDEDLCYSQHTPFGIVDRGCFNIDHNLSTYVCSCNLCNYISISEMPYIFSTRRDWVENVIELSRTRRLRKSVLKDMSCLRCEVNTSSSMKTESISDNVNCLHGNIINLPTEECSEDQICGVKAIRSYGYIWRGCLNKPLYNYWWTLCDSDLCNYDRLVSIYDEL